MADPTSVGCYSFTLSGFLGRNGATSRRLVQPRHRFGPGVHRLRPRVPLIPTLKEVAIYLHMRYTIDPQDRAVIIFHELVLPLWLRYVFDWWKRNRLGLRLGLCLCIGSVGGIRTLQGAIEDERDGSKRIAHDGCVVLCQKRKTLPFSEHRNMDTQRSVRLPMSSPTSRHPEVYRPRSI